MVSLPSPGHGPLITAIRSIWNSLDLPKPSAEYYQWIRGATPLSTNKEVVVAIATYFIVIFGGRELMR